MIRFDFRPTYTFTIIVLVLLPIFISLGFWQLHRAEEKRLLQAKFDARNNFTPITIEQAQNLSTNNYYPVHIEGHFDNAHNFLLDNQFYHHNVGYQIITPFRSEKTQYWVLINRGWVPMGRNRNTLPSIPAITGTVYLKGFLYTPKKNPFISSDIESMSWPLRIESLNLLSISKHLNRAIYPQIILLDPNSPYGFVRDWQPVNMKASMHTGYAVQWFLMATTLFMIYLGVSIKR